MNKSILPILLAAAMFCSPGKKDEESVSEVPYPPDSEMVYYQQQCDSGYQDYWTDIKAVSSAFLNNSRYASREVKVTQLRIKEEELLNGTIEVWLPDVLLELRLERRFKNLGRKSIWQVVEVKEKPWPKSDSKSGR